MKIKANGIEMNYELTGEGNCLVLIHGFGDNLHMWFNQVPEFSKKYRVLTYDIRGFGGTEMIKGPYSMGLFADDLYELLGVLGIKSACVLGHSLGGGIGLELAIGHPEMVKGLIFANSGVAVPRTPQVQEHFKMMIEVLQKGDIEIVAEALVLSGLSPGFKEKDPITFKKYKEIKMRNNPSAMLALMKGMAPGSVVPPDLSRLRCPVLIIAGENDIAMPASGVEQMKSVLKGAMSKVLPTGHGAPIEAPKEFNQVVFDFLKGLGW